MFDSETATIESSRLTFEKHVADHAADTRAAGMRYLTALSAFVDAFNKGPGANPLRMNQDTTGSLVRIENRIEWAEAERHRVRRVLANVA